MLPMATSIGVVWSREQISWATYATSWGQDFFDERIGMLANAGLSIMGTRIDLLWKLWGESTYSFRVEPGVQQAFLYDRDGTFQILTPVQGAVNVPLSGRPRYLMHTPSGTVYSIFLPVLYR